MRPASSQSSSSGAADSDGADSASAAHARLATESETRAVEAAELAADSKWFYIKRVGYNDMKFYEGRSKKSRGPAAYYVDVAAKLVGWDITLRQGGDKTGEPILHMKKAIRLMSCLGWDKGSKMKIRAPEGVAASTDGEVLPSAQNDELNRALSRPDSILMMPEAAEQQAAGAGADAPSNGDHAPAVQQTAPAIQVAGAQKQQEAHFSAESDSESDSTGPEGSPRDRSLEDGGWTEVTEASVADSATELTEAEARQLNQDFGQLNINDRQSKYLAVLKRRNQWRSNRNIFEYKGRCYAWDYLLLFGAAHTLKDTETGEVVAVCRLRPGVTTQSITAWGLRQNGALEIMGSGLGMQDIVVATLIGMLEWRKHNNKVWIILLAAIPF